MSNWLTCVFGAFCFFGMVAACMFTLYGAATLADGGHTWLAVLVLVGGIPCVIGTGVHLLNRLVGL
jgi:hypothetical protein